jgi:DNA-binding response OmpR family regulator
MDQPRTKKILLIEDDKTLAEMYQNKLAHEGYQVVVSQNGGDGLEAAIRVQPDIILLDILLPQMDGMTVMKKLRQTPWGNKVPIIILTNLNPDDKILKGVVEDHPAYYLMKAAIDPSGIIEKIKEVLK